MRLTARSWCELPGESSAVMAEQAGRTGEAPPLPPKTRAMVNAAATVTVSPSVGLQVHSPLGTGTVPAVATPDTGAHVVTIKINPDQNTPSRSSQPTVNLSQWTAKPYQATVKVNQTSITPSVTSVQLNVDNTIPSAVTAPSSITIPVTPAPDGCVRISVGSNPEPEEEMLQRPASLADSFIKGAAERSSPYFFCNGFACATVSNAAMGMTSGQCSPSDTLDSGTCSDLDGTPPPLPKKKSVTVTVIGAQHKRAESLTSSGAEADSDDNDSNLSCDSLNSSELNAPPPLTTFKQTATTTTKTTSSFLPQGLLQDIRDRSAKLTNPKEEPSKTDSSSVESPEKPTPAKAVIALRDEPPLVNESTYEERKLTEKQKEIELPVKIGGYTYETDKYYKFHLNENVIEEDEGKLTAKNEDLDQETFAGYRDYLGCNGSSTIRSAKGTVRGVKNRVRAGIATFLQIQNTTKSYKEKDAGKVVVYTTTMGIVRNTYHQCLKVKQILRTHLVKFEERDVFMSSECQAEIRDRMHSDQILVPQVFVDGQHIGDAEAIERLNENGELRRILKPYKSADACTTCTTCGGYRLLPCPVCNGSKKSVHRNHFTTEFVALKCMNCDEVGLVRCSSCS